MPTIRDVARLAKVSISTVSLAVSDPDRVSQETLQRIWQVAQEIGYTPNPVAQSLKSGRSKLIGMVVGDISNPFFGSILKEVERFALGRGYLIIAVNTDGDIARERAALAHLNAQRTAGVVLFPHGQGDDYLAELDKLRMPIVLIDHKVEGARADFIAGESALATAMLTEHMLRFGHRRIAYIGGTPGLWTSEERRRGFIETMASAGVEIDRSLVVSGGYRGDAAYAEAMRLLTRRDRPTAILAANNVMALGVLQAISDLGFRCPADVSLTTIDDVPWSSVIQPRITTAVQPLEEIAQLASEWLFDRIDRGRREAIPRREKFLMPRLQVGQSCAPPSLD